MPASSFVNRDHAGGAVDTTITAPIIGTTLSISINDATGWPTGGANGPFHIILSYDVSGKEKVEVQSRTGTTLTIADTGKRGIDGTSAQSHAFGAKIRHCVTAIDIQESNDHITNTALDHHTQYHTAGRHAAVSHTQAMLGTDSVGAAQIQTSAVGSAELAANAVIAGKLANGAVDLAARFAAGVVDSAAILDGAVNTAELAAGAVTDPKLAAGVIANGAAALGTNQTLTYVSASDPGAVGSGKIWFDTTNQLVKVRDSGNTSWNIFGVPTTDRVHSTSNFFNNVTLGAGGTAYRDYSVIGDFVFVAGGFVLGTGGDVTGEIQLQVPFDMDTNITAIPGGARCFDASTTNGFSGTCTILATQPGVFRGALLTGASVNWDANTPFNWTNGDTCFFFGAYWKP